MTNVIDSVEWLFTKAIVCFAGAVDQYMEVVVPQSQLSADTIQRI
jgi:hypothetical protein